MWSPRFDKRRPQRLLEEPPNVTRKMRGLDSGANARSDVPGDSSHYSPNRLMWGHRRICSKTYFKRHRGTQSADFAGPNPLFERFGRPDVVAIEADELPADRSDVGEELVVQRFALGAKLCRAEILAFATLGPSREMNPLYLRTVPGPAVALVTFMFPESFFAVRV